MIVRPMIGLIITIFAAYATLMIYMAVFQRKFMYHPAPGPVVPAMFGLHDFSDQVVTSDDGTKLQLWYHEADKGKATIIYFHGNAGNLSNRAEKLAGFARQGLGVAAISYRGYGKSEGAPDEAGIYADARAAVKWVKSRGIPLSNIAFYGESLGTGVAIRMASELPPKYVFLEAPYTSVAGRAAEIYWYLPVNYLIRDKFDSMSLIDKLKTPIMMFQGRRDMLIPPHHAERLFEKAPEPKKAHFFDDVGHTDFDADLIAKHVAEAIQ